MNNKKIVFKVTRAYMKKNRKRTIITFLGIMLMVMMMTAVFVGKDTFMTYLTDIISQEKGSWHFQAFDVDRGTAGQIAGLKSVERLEVSRDRGYTLFEKSGKPDDTPFLEIKEYSGDIFKWMNINVLEGRYPENDGELLISKRAIDDGSDIKIGDTIEAEFFERYIHVFGEKGSGEMVFPFQNMFTVGHGETKKAPAHFPYYGNDGQMEEIHEYTGYKCTYTIVGIMEPPFYEMGGEAGYTALGRGSNEIADGERVNIVGTTFLNHHGETIDTSLSRILGSYGEWKVNDYLLTFAGKGSNASFNNIAVFFQVFFMVLIVAASAVLIYNVFNISYRERAGYLGLLSSVGATGSQKRWSVYYEVFSLLAFALPLGLLAGLGLVWGGMTLLVPHVKELMQLASYSTLMKGIGSIGFRIIVNPLNILMIVLFSIAAVWVSALIPARRIGKTGAISSIRGNESKVGKKFRHNRLMGAISARMLKKGKCLSLLSDASVNRSRFLSRGIIRSMVIFVSLTLIVSFGVRTINDIIDLKSSDSTYTLGKDYEGYEYAISTSDAEKYSYMKEYLLGSEDVTGAKESRVLSAISIRKKYLSDEYIKGVKEVVSKYRPDGVLEEEASYLNGDEMDCSLWMLILTDEEYLELAKKAGADMSIVSDTDAPSVLMLDKTTITTDNYRYAFRDAAEADYAIYSLKDPVNVKVGGTIEIDSYSHNPEGPNELFSGEAVFAGYVSEEDLASLYKVDDRELWVITTMPSALKLLGTEEADLDKYYFYYTALLFNVTDDDCDAMKVLDSNSDPENPLYVRAELMFGLASFKGVIAKILRIVSVCFILLIMAICTLNLYNSVMGRCIERRGELAVLKSVGMTQSQLTGMLHLENAKLFAGSLGWSAIISAVFVVFLHKMAEHIIGRMTFSFPYVIIIGVCVLEIALLTIMTIVCYGRDKTSIMERIRDESISG